MEELQRIKSDLIQFHKKTNRVAYRNVETERKLDLLREYAERRYTFKHGASLKTKRTKFIQAKRHKRLFKRPCFVCAQKTTVRHHIIQLQHGGGNGRRNVIPLCSPCHAAIHPWLDPNYQPGPSLVEVAMEVKVEVPTVQPEPPPRRVTVLGPSATVRKYMRKKYGPQWQPAHG